jgi:hypothetical protein
MCDRKWKLVRDRFLSTAPTEGANPRDVHRELAMMSVGGEGLMEPLLNLAVEKRISEFEKVTLLTVDFS